MELPKGFGAYVANIGIKDTTTDFVVVAAESVCPAAGVFTQSRFSGPSVRVSRENIASQSARAVVVISKNANVATGEQGHTDAREILSEVANHLGCDPSEVLLASTGVIGRMYPMDNVRAGIRQVPTSPSSRNVDAVARAIMTTDTIQKVAEATIEGSNARIVGVAKGVDLPSPGTTGEVIRSLRAGVGLWPAQRAVLESRIQQSGTTHDAHVHLMGAGHPIP